MAFSYLDQTSRTSGKAAEKAELKKIDLYQELQSEYKFVPLVVEMMESWGPLGLKFIKEVGRKIQDISGEKKATFYLFQRISIAIQRGNTASILGTVGPAGKLDEIFYL